ncbi:uncharacterized protein PgNI_02575 [Pyricularia grisea]|uniref:Uncharacterized protein n=1 Tax=Pyricularia grisea TaxID=148305 RepID=A0A6P8BMG3_PYRGI|nr:uncharacterized protein PgNI_02575 [Pyricularia grisea]TLD17973.1 hypothetical protein PgNI_02575 [Pyricularia grisea]
MPIGLLPDTSGPAGADYCNITGGGCYANETDLGVDGAKNKTLCVPEYTEDQRQRKESGASLGVAAVTGAQPH